MLQTENFDHPDEAAAKLGVGDIQFTVRRPPEGEWGVTQLILENGARLVASRFAAAVSVVGLHAHDQVSVFWPLEKRRYGWTINRQPVRWNTAIVVHGAREEAATIEHPVRWAGLQIPIDQWPCAAFVDRLGTVELAPARAEALHEWSLRMLGADGDAAAPPEHSGWLGVFESLILPHLDPGLARARRAAPVELLLDRLTRFLRENPRAVLYPGDLEAVMGLRERALRQFFHDHFGMSVGQYLRLARLNNAHRDLRECGDGRRLVTEVAMKYGFYDLGRFASAYREVFGELPSETLRR